MWIQAIAIILPRVQRHFDVADSHIGTLSSSMFAGMMFGAIGWGTCSDLLGRIAAFNATLFFTAIFGIVASFAQSFLTLCFCLFLLGSAVGGSMPTDGTLLLEHMPKSKQYLVTALSVFFSFGSVLAAVAGLFVIPQHSCLLAQTCDVDKENQGWRYLLLILAALTLSMFIGRIVFFRLHESPRYLVHAGRPLEAIESLELISRFNGDELKLDLKDVADHHPPSGDRLSSPTCTTPLGLGSASLSPSLPSEGNGRPPLVTQYNSTDAASTPLHDSSEPTVDSGSESCIYSNQPYPPTTSRTGEGQSHYADGHIRSSRDQVRQARLRDKVSRRTRLPPWLRAWWDRVMMVLTPEWMRTTLVVWTAWFDMSLAFTMFNVYLPKLLETQSSSPARDLPHVSTVMSDGTKTLEESLWDVVIFALGGLPGAILGAYLIESRLGRQLSLAGSTFFTAFFCALFAVAHETWTVRLSTVGISLSATTMWAVLYGWTPEIFGTKVRGTACGTASALSRIGGMIAPMLGGTLLAMDRTFPVYASAFVFVIAGVCVLLVP